MARYKICRVGQVQRGPPQSSLRVEHDPAAEGHQHCGHNRADADGQPQPEWHRRSSARYGLRSQVAPRGTLESFEKVCSRCFAQGFGDQQPLGPRLGTLLVTLCALLVAPGRSDGRSHARARMRGAGNGVMGKRRGRIGRSAMMAALAGAAAAHARAAGAAGRAAGRLSRLPAEHAASPTARLAGGQLPRSHCQEMAGRRAGAGAET